MSATGSLRELLFRIREGDRTASDELFRRYGPALRRAVRVRCPHHLRAADDKDQFFASVIKSLWRTLESSREIGDSMHLLALGAAIARHKRAEYVRHRNAACRDFRRVDPAGQERLSEQPGREPAPEDRLVSRDWLALVRDQISPDDFALLQKRFGQDMTYADLARELGLQEAAVRQRLCRLVRTIRDRLGEGD